MVVEATSVVDQKIEECGGFGRYQVLHTFLINTASRLVLMWQFCSIIFVGYYNDHHCTIPTNATKDDYIPVIEGPGGDPMFDQCRRYVHVGSNETIECDQGWTFDPEYFHYQYGTIVMEWNLVCGSGNLVEVATMLINLGTFIGTLVGSPLGDRFGRKRTYFIHLICLVVCSTATIFSTDIIFFSIFSFCRGLSMAGVFTHGAVLGIEIIPKRVLSSTIPVVTMLVGVGQLFVVMLAYLFRQWRHLQAAVTVATSLFLFYYWWCPESLLWLYEKGRLKELDRTLHKIAKMNKKPAPVPFAKCAKSCHLGIDNKVASAETDLNESKSSMKTHSTSNLHDISRSDGEIVSIKDSTLELTNKTSENTTRVSIEKSNPFKDFFGRPRCLRFFVISCFISFTTYICEYGLMFMQSSLTGSLYVIMAVNAAMVMAGALSVIVPLQTSWIGRKYSLMANLFCLGSFLVLSAISEYLPVPNESLLATAFALIARFFQSGATASINLYGNEIAPNSVRSTVLGSQTGFGHLGSLVAPFISMSLIRIYFWLPCVIYATLAFISAFLLLLMPETLGRNLPQTASEVEQWPLKLTSAEKYRLQQSSKKESKTKNTGS